MKLSVINLEKFHAELRDSGITASLDYHEDEEAYVLNVGEPIADGVYKGKSSLQIAPGFLHRRPSNTPAQPEILAYADRVMIFTPDGTPAEPESESDHIVFAKLDGFLRGECEQLSYSFR